MKCGLLPLCPEAMTLGELSYVDFDGTLEGLGEALGPTNKVGNGTARLFGIPVVCQ